MNHPALQEITKLVDGELGESETARLREHLAVCELCRRELRFQQSLTRTARGMPLTRTSNAALSRIVSRILPPNEGRWVAKVVDNLGNVIAMTLVLAAIGYITVRFSPQPRTEEQSQLSVVGQSLGYVGEQIDRFLSPSHWPFLQTLRQIPYTSESSHSARIYSLALLSMLMLIAIDWIFQRRIKRLNS